MHLRLLALLVLTPLSEANEECINSQDVYACSLLLEDDQESSSLSLLQRGAVLKEKVNNKAIQQDAVSKEKVSNKAKAAQAKNNDGGPPAPSSGPLSFGTLFQNFASFGYSMPVMVAAFIIANFFSGPSGNSYAICAAMCFGCTGYVLALSGKYSGAATSPMHGLAFMSWVWIFFGGSAIVYHIVFLITNKEYHEEWRQLRSVESRVWLSYIIAAVFTCAGQAVLQLVCVMGGLGGSAPHFAVASAHSLVVAPFFMCFMGERISSGQLFGLLAVAFGVFIEALAGWKALLASLVVTIVGGVPFIALRLAELWGSPPCLGILIRFGCMSVCGVIVACTTHFYYNIPWPSPSLMLLAFYAAFVISSGYWATIRGYQSSECKAGIICGIMSLNSIVMGFFNYFIQGWLPTLTQGFGMTCVVVGCITMGLNHEHIDHAKEPNSLLRKQ